MAKSHDNYNLNGRLLWKRRIRDKRTWRFLLIGVTLSAFIALLFQDVAVFIGLMICMFCLLLIAPSMMPFKEHHAEAFARSIGWRHHATLASAVGSRQFQLLNDQPFFHTGTARRPTLIVSGTIQQIPMTIFRYSFEYKAGATNNLYQFTVWTAHLPRDIGTFSIIGDGVMDFSHFIERNREEAVTLEGDFGRTYSVFIPKVDDRDEMRERRARILSILSPDTMQLCIDYFGNGNLIAQGTTWFYVTNDDLYDTTAVKRLAEGAERLAQKINRQNRLQAASRQSERVKRNA